MSEKKKVGRKSGVPVEAKRGPMKIVVEVRRDEQGKAYSQIRDLNVQQFKEPTPVVIDRQKGRQFDIETVIHRAQAIAKLLNVPYHEELDWPCRAEQGWNDCQCPKCKEKVNERAARTRR